ncbi:RidA family protein [Microvirga calopogonii]|uniref:RidA family protein n=1 Tax=Microvirga calopogonii TaxID=2078013 RepID=UPI000E0D93E3|nr:RidA family protein [Microvirga calopogonii]
MSKSIAERLRELGLALPQISTPVANYIPWTRSGDLIFISGQIPQENGQPAYIGRLGDTISIEDGRRAAELCALNLLAHIDAIAGGELARVRRIVRLGGFVSCIAEFDQQPQVINGASDLMVAVFGENGRHARTAVGVTSLPRGVAVEVDATVEIAF